MITLEQALAAIAAARAEGRRRALQPLTVVVLDGGGHVVAAQREDGSSNKRFEIAHGKAHGALALGLGSRALMRRAEQQAYFIASVTAAVGPLVPVPGGVLVRDAGGAVVGAVGVSGDTSDHDEAVAIVGIESIGFVADPG